MRIQPFMNTRNICFNDEGIMLAISASSGVIVAFNAFTFKEEYKVEVPAPIMSMRLLNKNLLVTTQKYIYYMVVERKNKNYLLIEKGKYASPFNSGSIIVEGAFFNGWIVALGEEQFRAFHL